MSVISVMFCLLYSTITEKYYIVFFKQILESAQTMFLCFNSFRWKALRCVCERRSVRHWTSDRNCKVCPSDPAWRAWEETWFQPVHPRTRWLPWRRSGNDRHTFKTGLKGNNNHRRKQNEHECTMEKEKLCMNRNIWHTNKKLYIDFTSKRIK